MVLLVTQVPWDVWLRLRFLWKGENLQYLVRDCFFDPHKYVFGAVLEDRPSVWLSFDRFKYSH